MFNQRKSIWKVITIIAVVIVAVAAFVPTGIVSAASPTAVVLAAMDKQIPFHPILETPVPPALGRQTGRRVPDWRSPLTEAEAVALQEAILKNTALIIYIVPCSPSLGMCIPSTGLSSPSSNTCSPRPPGGEVWCGSSRKSRAGQPAGVFLACRSVPGWRGCRDC